MPLQQRQERDDARQRGPLGRFEETAEQEGGRFGRAPIRAPRMCGGPGESGAPLRPAGSRAPARVNESAHDRAQLGGEVLGQPRRGAQLDQMRGLVERDPGGQVEDIEVEPLPDRQNVGRHQEQTGAGSGAGGDSERGQDLAEEPGGHVSQDGADVGGGECTRAATDVGSGDVPHEPAQPGR